jgi:hypothetical protein
MTTDGPKDPSTPLSEAATSMHELYMELQSAGFSKKEAFELVKEGMRGIAAGAQGPQSS